MNDNDIGYVPFSDSDENKEQYGNYLIQPKQTLDFLYRFLDGMWIRNRCSKTLCQVVSIGAGGVYLGGIEIKVDWFWLYDEFEFLDGSPCGKESKNV